LTTKFTRCTASSVVSRSSSATNCRRTTVDLAANTPNKLMAPDLLIARLPDRSGRVHQQVNRHS